MLSVDIKKRLGEFLLDVSFEAGDEVMALLGASGCGKSLTLKCIAGIETPDEGNIVLDGVTLFDSQKKINLPPQRRKVGKLFQQYALFPNMTARQNIAVGVTAGTRAERDERTKRLISSFRLEGMENKRPHQLSGGQQQRVALARLLAGEPELILLDEPFSALDDYLKWQLELELFEILSDFGKTVILVSHSRDEVYRLCGSVCTLSGGRSEEKHTVRELFEAPQTLSACVLSGCKNYSGISDIDGDFVTATDWGVTLRLGRAPQEDAKYVGIRAHYVKPAYEDGENTIECEVLRVIDNMFSMIVMLKTPGGEGGYSRLRMELPKEEWARIEGAETVRVCLAPQDLMPLL